MKNLSRSGIYMSELGGFFFNLVLSQREGKREFSVWSVFRGEGGI